EFVVVSYNYVLHRDLTKTGALLNMSEEGSFTVSPSQDGTVVIGLVGAWRLMGGLHSATDLQGRLGSPNLKRVAFDTRNLTAWDSSILTFLIEISELCRQRRLTMDREGLPEGVRKLLDLAEAVPERKGARREAAEATWLEQIGASTVGAANSLVEMLSFLGEM